MDFEYRLFKVHLYKLLLLYHNKQNSNSKAQLSILSSRKWEKLPEKHEHSRFIFSKLLTIPSKRRFFYSFSRHSSSAFLNIFYDVTANKIWVILTGTSSFLIKKILLTWITCWSKSLERSILSIINKLNFMMLNNSFAHWFDRVYF